MASLELAKSGITTALRLKQAGARVVVLEAAEVASGVTGCTTAKVSALQATMLSTIRSRHDAETVALYAQALMMTNEFLFVD